MKSVLIVIICLACVPFRAASSNAADGKLLFTVVDAKTHKPVAGRMHLTGPGKRPKKIEGVPFWSDHFVFPGTITLNLPTGFYTFELERGPEYFNVTGNFTINRFADDSKEVELRRVVDMSEEGWWSGDLHLRRDYRDIELIMLADDLHVGEAVTWWNDKNDLSGKTLKLPRRPLVNFDQDLRAYEWTAGG